MGPKSHNFWYTIPASGCSSQLSVVLVNINPFTAIGPEIFRAYQYTHTASHFFLQFTDFDDIFTYICPPYVWAHVKTRFKSRELQRSYRPIKSIIGLMNDFGFFCLSNSLIFEGHFDAGFMLKNAL